jgi:hypothetical protein
MGIWCGRMAGVGWYFSIFDSTFGLSSKNFDSAVRFCLIPPLLGDLAFLVEGTDCAAFWNQEPGVGF